MSGNKRTLATANSAGTIAKKQKDEITVLKNAVKELEKKLKEAVDNNKRDARSYERESANQKAEIETLQQQLRLKDAIIENRDETIKQLETQAQSSTVMKNAMKELEDKIKKAQEEKNQEDRLNESAIANRDARIKELEHQLRLRDATIVTCNATIKRLKQDKSRTQKQNMNAIERSLAAEASLRAQVEENGRLIAANTKELELQLRLRDATIVTCNATIKRLKQDKSRTQKQNMNAIERSLAAEASLRAQVEENGRLIAANTMLQTNETSKKGLEKKVGILTEENKALNIENWDLSAKIQASAAVNQNLRDVRKMLIERNQSILSSLF